jgi:membrane-associated phospholipid phosphatase
MLFLSYLGLYAPIILFLITLILLRNKLNYLIYFLLGFGLSNILNIILKFLIKAPRPSNDDKTIEFGIKNNSRSLFDKYGMPSNHAQSCAYILVFSTMFLNLYMFIFYVFLTTVCIFQRYLFNNHSLLQLFVGFIIGSIVGYFTYIVANNKIKGVVNLKKDDDAPL